MLIASILSDQQIKDFTEVAEKLELDYLIEVHDEEELRRIENFENALIGVNNRNLNTFEVDINNSVKLKASFKGKNIFILVAGGVVSSLIVAIKKLDASKIIVSNRTKKKTK